MIPHFPWNISISSEHCFLFCRAHADVLFWSLDVLLETLIIRQTSDNENEWPRVVQRMTTSDNKW